jgi:hypothetical protein
MDMIYENLLNSLDMIIDFADDFLRDDDNPEARCFRDMLKVAYSYLEAEQARIPVKQASAEDMYTEMFFQAFRLQATVSCYRRSYVSGPCKDGKIKQILETADELVKHLRQFDTGLNTKQEYQERRQIDRGGIFV